MAKSTPVAQSAFYTGIVDALPIATDSISSRVIVDNRLLSVTEFALDAEQSLSEHTSTRAVTITVVDGCLRFTIAGETQDVYPGDVIYMAPNELHALEAPVATHFILTQIKVDEIPAEVING